MNCDVAVCLKTNVCAVIIYTQNDDIQQCQMGKGLLVKSFIYEVKSLNI